MNITFTRSSERVYQTLALRDDGVLLEVPSFDRKFPLPHDLAHYVVERELGLRHGFWGCIASGALFPGIKVISGRPRPDAGTRSQAVIREAGQQGTEAEVLVGVLLKIIHTGLENDWAASHALLDNEWKPNKPCREPLRAEEVKRVGTALREAEQRWQALEVGQSLTVEWTMEKRSGRQPRRHL